MHWRPVPSDILARDESAILEERDREQRAAQARVAVKRATRLALKRPGPRTRVSPLGR
jgi:hypothetical protein